MAVDVNRMGARDFSKHFVSKETLQKCWVTTVSDYYDVSEARIQNMFDNNYIDHEIVINNTARGTVYDDTALNFLHKAYDDPFVLVENGIMFVNQEHEVPPLVSGEMELFDTRKEFKKLGNYYLTEGNDPVLGQLYDLRQSMN